MKCKYCGEEIMDEDLIPVVADGMIVGVMCPACGNEFEDEDDEE